MVEHGPTKVLSLIFVIVLLIPTLSPVGADQGDHDTGSREKNTGTLWGFVTDTSGTGLENAQINLKNTDSSGYSPRTVLSQTGGYYSVDLGPGQWDLRVTKSGYFELEDSVKIHRGEVLRYDFVMVKIPPITSSVRGKVIDNVTKNPIFNALIQLLDITNNYMIEDNSNILGNYNIDTFAGTFIIIVSKSGYLPKFYGGIAVPSDTIVTLDIELHPQPPIDARIIGDVTYQLDDGGTGEAPYASIMVYDKERSFITEFKADQNGHFDVTLYEATYLFLVRDENVSYLDARVKNVTSTSGGVEVANFKLTELKGAFNKVEMDLTGWDQVHAVMNMTHYGRSEDSGSGGGLRMMRFIVDLYLGNGDLYASNEEMDVFLSMYENELKNSFGLFDTKDDFLVDGIDYIFDEEVKSLEVDAAGHIFGDRPQTITLEIGAHANGTIDTSASLHQIWLNFDYGTMNQTEEYDLIFDPQLKLTDLVADPYYDVEELEYGRIRMIPLLDPDTTDDVRGTNVTFGLMDRFPPTADAGGDLTVDEDKSFELNATASSDNFGISYYRWDLGDGNVTNVTTPIATHTYSQPGNYTVSLTVGDGIYQEDTDTIWVLARDITPPTMAIIFDPTEVPEDMEVELKANVSDNVKVERVLWQIDDTNITNGTTFLHTFDQPGIYTVTAIAMDPTGLTAQASVQVTVTDETPPTADAGQDMSVNESEEVRFDASASTDNVGVVRYTWNFGDGSSNTTGEISTHKYDQPGTYTVVLTVKDAAGHTGSTDITITVLDVTPPLPHISVLDTSIEIRKKVEFNASTSSDNVGIVEYRWDFGDGHQAIGEVVDHKYKRTGERVVTLTVTDAAGQSTSTNLTVDVWEQESPIGVLFIIGLLLVIGMGVGIGAFMLYRRWRLGGYKIDEIFVIYQDGRLIRHISASPTRAMDKDVIASMLTAVQDFVKESLRKQERGEHLGKLEYGKKTKILIERGKRLYLAVVLSGHDPESLRGNLQKQVKRLEEDYGKELKAWDGDQDAFEGMDEIVVGLMEA